MPAIVITVAALFGLTACSTPNWEGYSPVVISSTVSVSGFPGKVVRDDTFLALTRKPLDEGVGALLVRPTTDPRYETRYWLNGEPLGYTFYGYIWLPLMPGDYTLRYQIKDSTDGEVAFPIKSGETTYVMQNVWEDDGPYAVVSKAQWDEKFHYDEPTYMVLDRPQYAYLPPKYRAYVAQCEATTIETRCQKALDDIPPILIGEAKRKELIAVVSAGPPEPAPVAKARPVMAATAPQVVAEPAQRAKAPAAMPTLPPDKERDRLMIQIADLFKAGKQGETLPLFGRLDALPVPIDPTVGYYWTQALLAAGDRRGASVRLSRFLQQIDAGSPYYAPALRLMTRIGGSS